MKYYLLFLLICLSNSLLAQNVYTIKADSVKITGCDSAELIIENHTQNIPGFLFNTGNGRTIFKRAFQKINDSLFLFGADTLKIQGIRYAKNGLSIPDTAVILGQAYGSSGNPARLLMNTEIPLNGKTLKLIDTLNSSTIKSNIRFFDTTATTGLAPLKIIQNSAAGVFTIMEPYNYGTTYHSAYAPHNIQRPGRVLSGYGSEASLDSMPDNVYNTFCYNCNYAAARLDTSEAAARIGFETNYLNSVDGVALNFEYHNPEITTFDGRMIRTDSKYINKTSGFCYDASYIDNHEYFSVKSNQIFAQLQATNAGDYGSLYLYGGSLGSGLDGKILLANRFNGFISTIQSKDGQMVFQTNTATNSYNAFGSDGNVYLNQSVSLNPTTIHATYIGMDSVETGPAASAQLEVVSKHKGILIPRMTTAQQNAISSPATGLIIFNTDSGGLVDYTGSAWLRERCSGACGGGGAFNGTIPSSLAVNGTITAQKLRITPTRWSDYVFAPDYRLPSLESVEKYIRQNNHLPGIPSAVEAERKGIDVGESQAALLKKIEELTLYIIRQNKELQQQDERIKELSSLKNEVAELKKLITGRNVK